MKYKIVQKIGERLIQIRLWIEEHKYIYIMLNFIFIRYFLMNQTLFGITYLYLFIIKISRMTLFLIDNNYKTLKIDLDQPQVNDDNMKIIANKRNSHIMLYWCTRNLDLNKHYIKLNYVYSDFDTSGLVAKEFEQDVIEIEHGFKNGITLDVKMRKIKNLTVILAFYGKIEDLLSLTNPKALKAKLMQIINSTGHPTKMIYDTGKTEYIVGTTKYEKSNDIMHGKVSSGYYYKPKKEQAFSDRKLIDNSLLTEKQLFDLKLLDQEANEKQATKNYKLAEEFLEKVSKKNLTDNIPYETTMSTLIKEAENETLKKIRDKSEALTMHKNETQRIQEIERVNLGVESFGIKRNEKTLTEIEKIDAKYNAKSIKEAVNQAKDIHRIKFSQVVREIQELEPKKNENDLD